MVLQYRQLCLSRRMAKSVYFVFKFCLYIVYRVWIYFRKFPVCIWLFVQQNLERYRAILTMCWYPRCAMYPNEAEIEACSLPVPRWNQRGKMLRQSLKRWSRAEFQCRIPEVTSFVVMDAKSCVKTCKYFRKP